MSTVEAELSVWSPEALERLLPWCEARGIGFLAAMPLGNGFLTGTLTPGQGFEPDDLRARHPRFTAEIMASNQPLVVGLRRIAERYGATAGAGGAGVGTDQGAPCGAAAGDEAGGVGGGERAGGGSGADGAGSGRDSLAAAGTGVVGLLRTGQRCKKQGEKRSVTSVRAFRGGCTWPRVAVRGCPPFVLSVSSKGNPNRAPFSSDGRVCRGGASRGHRMLVRPRPGSRPEPGVESGRHTVRGRAAESVGRAA